VVIEQVRWDPRAITAAQVLSLPEFREATEAEGGTTSQGLAREFLFRSERRRGN